VSEINLKETTDVDVETLMNSIRRRAQAVPDAMHIMGEVGKGRLYADGITQATRQSAGWKGRAKSRVTKLILRSVRRNLHLQRAFNHLVVDVLQLIAEDLYAHEKRLPAARESEPGPTAVEHLHAPANSSQEGLTPGGHFDQARYEEKYLDLTPYCRRSLAIFRELLNESDLALELGCGQGQLLSMFAENGITAVGVDSDQKMVLLCQRRGLRALCADIFDYLRNAPDASIGGIFSGRVVERLTNEQTLELLELAGRKLRRGGIFVVEATNIDHIPALREFYMDPSLVRPVPVRLMEFILERSRFRIHHFRFSSKGGGQSGEEELRESALSQEAYPYGKYTVAAVRS